MSCSSLPFSQTHTILGTFGISITINVPEVYNCSTIQLRLRSETTTVEDWFDYAILSSTSTTINYTFPPGVCYIDVRIVQCCPQPPLPPDTPEGPPPGPPPEDPPCALITEDEGSECSENTSFTNPYRRPSDSSVSTAYNEISIPKKVNLKITQTNCSDISALLCTVRCVAEPTDVVGDCPCEFIPWVDVYTLPQLPIGREPYGTPIDIDTLCNYDGGLRCRPQFNLPTYTKIEAYTDNRYGYSALPFINGIGYDTTGVSSNGFVKVHTCNNSEELRLWIHNNFRFFGVDASKTSITNAWPYTDLYWHPFDFCIANNKFTPENGVAYVKLIPC